ncbi:ROK family transcriptional regulator [Longispora sp. NPDC051575]|uniref:ROK family transcriptional regulator n=1 Tax=Longispora sp. NPDC051575 TaxID=3154943 RepID=UPI00343DAC1B
MARVSGSSRLLGAINESAALAHLLDSGPLTRADLRALIGLSKPSTSEVLRRLQDAGLALTVGRTQSGGPGPTAEIYAANPEAGYAAAVSVRKASTVAAAVCDLTGAPRGRIEIAVDFAATDPVAAVTGAVEEVCRRAGLRVDQLDHVQIAIPGSHDERTDVVRHIHVPGWERPGLLGEIRRGYRASHVDNDVNLAAVAERHRGVASADPAAGFAMLWLGEGVGLAIDLGGTLLRGARQGAGEIGYMPVGLPGAARRPDFEELVGGPAVLGLAAEYGFVAGTAHEVVGLAVAGILGAAGGEQGGGPGGAGVAGAADGAGVAGAVGAELRGAPARAGSVALGGDTDSAAGRGRAFIGVLAERIAVGLAAVVAVLDPPLVVLAGDVSQAGADPLRAAVEAALGELGELRTPIAVTGVDDDAVLFGALEASLAAVREALFARLGRPVF